MINFNRLKKHPRNLAFVDEFYRLTFEHPFSNALRIYQMHIGGQTAGVMFELTDGFKDGQMRLGYISSNPRRIGAGSAALDWFISLADKHGITLSLDVVPQGARGEGLNKKQLKGWYKSRSFVVKGDEAVRACND